MSTSDKSIKDFEKSLLNLEQIVQKMESGELGLEDSLKQFQNALSSAELKVNQLIEQNGLQKTLPFDEQNG